MHIYSRLLNKNNKCGTTSSKWFQNFLSSQQEAFNKAAEEVKVLKQRPDYAEISSLYGLYKQSTVGDVNIGEFKVSNSK